MCSSEDPVQPKIKTNKEIDKSMEAEGRLEVARARAVVMSSNCKSV